MIETLNLLAFRSLQPFLLPAFCVLCSPNFVQMNCLLIIESYINAKWSTVRLGGVVRGMVQAAQPGDTPRVPTVPYVSHIDAGHLERADLQNTENSPEPQDWWGHLGLMMSTVFPSCNLRK